MRPLRDRPTPARPFDTGNADDDARLEALTDSDPLSVPRRWSHFLHFADESAALLAVEQLAGEWETHVRPSPSGEGTVVQALKDGVILTAPAVTQARADLTLLAQTLGGSYDGWQAWV